MLGSRPFIDFTATEMSDASGVNLYKTIIRDLLDGKGGHRGEEARITDLLDFIPYTHDQCIIG
jgi:hypothetical protein